MADLKKKFPIAPTIRPPYNYDPESITWYHSDKNKSDDTLFGSLILYRTTAEYVQDRVGTGRGARGARKMVV